jgi:hypothetical protein
MVLSAETVLSMVPFKRRESFRINSRALIREEESLESIFRTMRLELLGRTNMGRCSRVRYSGCQEPPGLRREREGERERERGREREGEREREREMRERERESQRRGEKEERPDPMRVLKCGVTFHSLCKLFIRLPDKREGEGDTERET